MPWIFSGLVAARIVSETSVGFAFFSLHLEVTVEHQLLCMELHSCIVLWTQCILPAFIPLPLRIAAL